MKRSSSRRGTGGRGWRRPLGEAPKALRGVISGEVALQRVEASLEHTVADQFGQFAFTPFVAVELGAPFGEAAVAALIGVSFSVAT